MDRYEASEAAKKVVRKLQRKKFEAFLVGGCVRDLLLHRDPKDFDIATNARPEQVQALFEKTIPVGAAFGVTVVVQDGVQVEVATYRADGEYTDGRRPDTVSYSKSAKEDVVRRDFTMNGLLLTPPMDFKVEGVTNDDWEMFDGDAVVDFVGGREDINNRLIRCIGDPLDRFSEDPLRMLRAVRFAAQLGFAIEEGTMGAILLNAHNIRKVSHERVAMELFKTVSAPHAAEGVALLCRTGLIRYALPECADFAGNALERFQRFPPVGDPILGMAMLLSGMDSDYLLNSALDGLKLSAEDRSQIAGAVRLVPELVRTMFISPAEQKRLARKAGFSHALKLFEQEAMVGKSPYSVDNTLRIVGVYSAFSPEDIRPKPLVTGDDLISMGLKPGPEFTAILGEIETHQLNGRLNTREEALAYFDNEGRLRGEK
jgi:poly(A) polymerase